MNLPRLLNGHTLTEKARFRPESLGITLAADGTSSATMTIPPDDAQVSVGNWVKVFAPNGESFVGAVKTISTDYRTGRRTVTVEHLFTALQDSIIFGKKTYAATQKYKAVLTDLLTYQEEKIWKLGTVDFDDGDAFEFNNTDVANAIDSVTDCVMDWTWTFSFDACPFTVNLKAVPTTPACEMRMSRNIAGLNIQVNKSCMYTRIYPVGAKNLNIKSVNSDRAYIDRNTDAYGIIAKVVTDQTITNAAALKKFGRAQLKRNAEPSVSVSCNGLLLSELTGEPFDRILINTVCRVPLPDYGTTVNERIVSLQWNDAIRDPMSVSVTMANERQTLSKKVKSESKRSSRASTRTGCDLKDADEAIDGVSTRVGTIENGWAAVVQESHDAYTYTSSLTLTPAQIEAKVNSSYGFTSSFTMKPSEIEAKVQSAENFEASFTMTPQSIEAGVNDYNNNKSAYLTINSDAITSKVSKNGVISAINQTAEQITIQASKINLEGYVQATDIFVGSGEARTLTSTNIFANTSMTIGTVYDNARFRFNGSTVKWQKIKPVTSVSGGTVTTKEVYIVYDNGVYYFVDNSGSRSSKISVVTNSVKATGNTTEYNVLAEFDESTNKSLSSDDIEETL